MYTIENKVTTEILNKLHNESSSEKFTVLKTMLKGVFRELRPTDMKDAYIAITSAQGKFIYNLLIQEKAKNVIEFGTSFGISTIYLGAAVKETGGRVITTELVESKSKKALQHFKEAQVDAYIELRNGDAMRTLKEVPDAIDFLLLDGWNDLYLPLVKMLEPKLKPGAYIYTDNIKFSGSKPFIEYLYSHPEKFSTKRLSEDRGGAELTQYIG